MDVVITRSPSSALLLFFGEGFPTKINYRKKGTLILTSLLEELDCFSMQDATTAVTANWDVQGTKSLDDTVL